ncbi:MAG: amidohydrolase family protein [Candidatus Polarisedimenticolia bacterium]
MTRCSPWARLSGARLSRVRLLSSFLVCLTAASAFPAHAERPRVYAITKARVIVAPDKIVPDGTVVLRDGLIEAAGRGVDVPPDAYVLEAAGRTVTAGFIDACSDIGQKRVETPPAQQGGPGRQQAPEQPAGTAHPIVRVRAERRVADGLVADGSGFEKHRAMGFTTALSLPADGIFRGQPAVLNLGAGAPSANLVTASAGQVVAFESGNFGQPYPTSLMGSISVIRQTLLDARRQDVWQARYASDPAGIQRPASVASLDALAGPASGRGRVFFDVPDSANVLRALSITREFALDGVVIASGLENAQHGAITALAAAGRPVILPLAYPEKPKVSDPDEALLVTTRDLERWDMAPANPAALEQAGVAFALGTCRAPSAGEFPARLRKAMERGLTAQTALAALTTNAARTLGLERTLGTLEPGKIANLVVWDGAPESGDGVFNEKAKPVHVFVDGIKHDIEQKASKGDPNARIDPRGTWSITLTIGGRAISRTWTITGHEGDYAGTAETQRGTVAFTSVKVVGNEMTVVLPGEGSRPSQEISVIVTGEEMEGSGEFPGGGPYTVKGTRTAGPEGGSL